jgi:hypothetical protein
MNLARRAWRLTRPLLSRAWAWSRAHPKISIPLLAAFLIIGAVTNYQAEQAKKKREAHRRNAAASQPATSAPARPAPLSTTSTVTVSSAAPRTSVPASARATTNRPRLVYPGRRENDIVAVNGAARISGFTMTLGRLHVVDDAGYGAKGLCSSVRLVNRDTATQDYSDLDFSIQTPDGNVKGALLIYTQSIDSGQLVHNGTAAGRVCFRVDGQPGTHIVSWAPDLYSTDPRAVWLFRL